MNATLHDDAYADDRLPYEASAAGSIASKYRPSRPRVETYGYMTPVAVPTPTAKPLPLFAFVTADGEVKRLTTPLMLRVTAEDGEIFVENEALNLFGHGRTLQAAVEEFSHDLAHFWAYYRALSDDQVAGDGASLKKLYAELVAS
jgi:hypothetical protein